MSMEEIKTVNVIDRIMEEIRHRYAQKSIIKEAIDNELAHNLHKNEFKLLNRHKVCFNQNLLLFMPNLTSKFPLPYNGNFKKNIYSNTYVEKYCEAILGYSPTTETGKQKIRQLLQNLAEKKLKLVVVGYGGAMINLLWDIYILSYISSFNDPIFESITIFEKENISITNILRIGKPIILESFLDVHVNEDGTLSKLNLIREESNLAKKFFRIHRYLTDPQEVQDLQQDGHIFIGAPNFEARKLLENTPFFFFGHANNELEIFYQPIVDMDLTFESYGSIDIPVLLSNIAAGSIALMDILNSVEIKNGKPQPNFEKSESLFCIDYNKIML